MTRFSAFHTEKKVKGVKYYLVSQAKHNVTHTVGSEESRIQGNRLRIYRLDEVWLFLLSLQKGT